jgi:hypothetical protein
MGAPPRLAGVEFACPLTRLTRTPSETGAQRRSPVARPACSPPCFTIGPRWRHQGHRRTPAVGNWNQREADLGMAVVTMRQLLESGVHFGHQTRRWNPKMKRFIMTERNGIYIIDLQQSLTYINDAYEFVKQTVAHGGRSCSSARRSRPRSRSPSRPLAWGCPTSTSGGSAACSPTSTPCTKRLRGSRSSRRSTSTTWPAAGAPRRSCSSCVARRTSSSAPSAASAS